ncbi:hypothetical protein ABKN59_012085 [Abortiporus biennis]
MPPAEYPPKAMGSIHDKYPDDSADKDFYLQANGFSYPGYGDRHVLLWWLNGNNTDTSEPIIQIIQITGQAGNYHYYYPVVQQSSEASRLENEQFLLGTYTRSQRDRILELCEEIGFSKKSLVNGCRVWTRDLFVKMVEEGLLSIELYNEVDKNVPLKIRLPEQ